MAPSDTPWLVAFFTLTGGLCDATFGTQIGGGPFAASMGASALRLAPALLAVALSAMASARRTRPRLRALLQGRIAVTFGLLGAAAVGLAVVASRSWLHGVAVALGQSLLLLIAAVGIHDLLGLDEDGWPL